MRSPTISVVLFGSLTICPCLLAQQPTSKATAELNRQLTAALTPLQTLSQPQMDAVAALVLTSRAGYDIDDYCPPLRKFQPLEKTRCLGEIATYASAVKECKKPTPTWKTCPKVLEAEAAWASCEFRDLRALVSRIKPLIPPGTPTPSPGPGPDPTPRRNR